MKALLTHPLGREPKQKLGKGAEEQVRGFETHKL
jgi:hypothetical protein